MRPQKSDARIFASVRANSPAIREARFARRASLAERTYKNPTKVAEIASLTGQFLRSELACANSDSPSEPSLANSGAIRSDVRKNPTEDASPAPGGTGLPREGRKLRARNWVGFGPRPARGGGGLPRPWRDGSAGVPHGLAPLTGPITTPREGRQFRLYSRTYPPEGGERRSPKGIVASASVIVLHDPICIGSCRQPVRDAAYANSDSTSEPTPPKGGSDDPLYI